MDGAEAFEPVDYLNQVHDFGDASLTGRGGTYHNNCLFEHGSESANSADECAGCVVFQDHALEHGIGGW
jgi:hypothetical protein